VLPRLEAELEAGCLAQRWSFEGVKVGEEALVDAYALLQ